MYWHGRFSDYIFYCTEQCLRLAIWVDDLSVTHSRIRLVFRIFVNDETEDNLILLSPENIEFNIGK